MNILINPTAVFRRSVCTLLVTMNGKRGLSTPKYELSEDKLAYSELANKLFKD